MKLKATANIGFNHLPSPVKAGETFECDEAAGSLCLRDKVAVQLDEKAVPSPSPPVEPQAESGAEESSEEKPTRRRRRRRAEESEENPDG